MTETARKPLALVIEDEAEYQHQLRAQLAAKGFSVVIKNNVADAAAALGLEYKYVPEAEDMRLALKTPGEQTIAVIVSDHDLAYEGKDYAALKRDIPELAKLRNAGKMLFFTSGGAFVDRLQASINEGFIPANYIPPVIAHCGNLEDMLANGRPDIVKATFSKGLTDDEAMEEGAKAVAQAAADLIAGKRITDGHPQGTATEIAKKAID